MTDAIAHEKVCLAVYLKMDIPQEVKVNGGELGLNQSPESPEEMRCLHTQEKEHNTKD